MLNMFTVKKIINEYEYWVNQRKQIDLMRGTVSIRDAGVYPNHLNFQPDTNFSQDIKKFCEEYADKKLQELRVELNSMSIKT